MLSVLKNAWKVADIRKKILFTLGIILLFRLGSAVPVPFFSAEALDQLFSSSTMQGSLFGYFNMLSGDAFAKGRKEGIRVYQFLREPIERYFGEEFWQALDQAAAHLNGTA